MRLSLHGSVTLRRGLWFPAFADRSCAAAPPLWRTRSKRRSPCSATSSPNRYVAPKDVIPAVFLDHCLTLPPSLPGRSQVICVHDVSSIYKVPLLLEQQGVVGYLSRRLNMPIETRPRKMLTKWKEMSDR